MFLDILQSWGMMPLSWETSPCPSPPQVPSNFSPHLPQAAPASFSLSGLSSILFTLWSPIKFSSGMETYKTWTVATILWSKWVQNPGKGVPAYRWGGIDEMKDRVGQPSLTFLTWLLRQEEMRYCHYYCNGLFLFPITWVLKSFHLIKKI